MKKILTILVVLLLQMELSAKNIVMPETIELFDTTYHVAYKQPYNWEYTNNESVENWTSLVTLIARPIKTDPKTHNLAFEKALSTQEVATYTYEDNEEYGYFLVVFKPTKKYMYYEAMIMKSFHLPQCDGNVQLQYAFKKVVFEAVSPEEDKKIVEALMNQLKSYQTILKANTWSPLCK